MATRTYSELKTIDSSDLRNNLKSALEFVTIDKKPLIIKQRNKQTAVLLDIDEFEDYLWSMNKNYMEKIERARAQSRETLLTFDQVFGHLK
jgi:prevent-host-death family protein